ncbi:MAG: hypothetical protein ACRCS7_02210 [Tannerellaceae bacterium]
MNKGMQEDNLLKKYANRKPAQGLSFGFNEKLMREIRLAQVAKERKVERRTQIAAFVVYAFLIVFVGYALKFIGFGGYFKSMFSDLFQTYDDIFLSLYAFYGVLTSSIFAYVLAAIAILLLLDHWIRRLFTANKHNFTTK